MGRSSFGIQVHALASVATPIGKKTAVLAVRVEPANTAVRKPMELEEVPLVFG